MQHASENAQGYLEARDRLNAIIVQRARRDYPAILVRDGIDAWGEVGMDYIFSRSATRIPWRQWPVCLGRLRPTGHNPIAWVRYFLLVRRAKREIERTIHDRWGNDVHRLARH